ncbi:NmrA-like family protein [Lasiodiplodia theobromae]|uniref:NmrA-like family protein n=1 Tax=Lasiodiplodia theobromae TaxID=45133 RepID=UPI0015C3232F|nr:NmrA-like family protein [Lasiodiplodia theobromae]KAF4535875.1 NmrA-like family protein [Lasiodiplodia theobromae]
MAHVVLAGGSGRVNYVTVDYENKTQLVEALRGVDVVLSFLADSNFDLVQRMQELLIDACVEAGVKRFAPSEWGTRSNSASPHYAFKDRVREYLEEVNRKETILEYCLFQPGFFTNFFAWPHKTTPHFTLIPMYVDFHNRRALVPGDGNFTITLTTIEDMAAVVAEALDYPGKWPTVGGIQGSQITIKELVELGNKLRGSMKVESVAQEVYEDGKLQTSWVPRIDHPAIPVELRERMSEEIVAGYFKAIEAGSWAVSDEWNKLLPHYRFSNAEEYLANVWRGKP